MYKNSHRLIPWVLVVSLSCSAANVLPKHSQLRALEINNPQAAEIAETIIQHYESRCAPLTALETRRFLSSSEYYFSLVGLSAIFGGVTSSVHDVIEKTQHGMVCGDVDAAMGILQSTLGTQ